VLSSYGLYSSNSSPIKAINTNEAATMQAILNVAGNAKKIKINAISKVLINFIKI